MNRPVWSLPAPIQAAAVPTAPQSEISLSQWDSSSKHLGSHHRLPQWKNFHSGVYLIRQTVPSKAFSLH